MRAMMAVAPYPSVRAGRMRCQTASRSAVMLPARIESTTYRPVGWAIVSQITGSLRPIGNHPRYTQKTMRSRMANQKRGIAAPLIDTTRVMWSGIRLRLAPANVPRAIPIETATTAEAMASSMVAASLSGNTSVTGAAATPDHPRSPVRTPDAQYQYCTGTGSFRWNFSSSWATSSLLIS
jgi:hypothetical protein